MTDHRSGVADHTRELIFSNITKMMLARGYQKKTDTIFENEKKEQIFVWYPDIPKINIDAFKYIITTMTELKVNDALVVYNMGLTSGVSNPPDKNIQFMSFKDLTINKIDHFLVPKYTLCTVAIPYKDEDLPSISIDEAIIRYYNFKKGSIIKIESKDGKYIEYKKVV